MSDASAVPPREGHPPGLYMLFFAEMWERFCFYGMRALLTLYMVSEVFSYDDAQATAVYGSYNALIYLTPIAGGILADRLLGYRWAILLGGLLMAVGQFTLVGQQEFFFYAGMAFMVVGNGMFKPNISTLVGRLYPDGDPRRDAGFTIFYADEGLDTGDIVLQRSVEIQATDTISSLYRDWLFPEGVSGIADAVKAIEDGTATNEELKEIRDFTLQNYEYEFEQSKTYQAKPDDWLSSRWSGFKSPSQMSRIRPTGVDTETLKMIGMKAGSVPEGFKLHRQMQKIFKARSEMAKKGTGIDWGTAEAMAFGSLLIEGNHVRITGQDVQRGTFSHRHAVVKDQDTEEEYTPLNSLAQNLDMSAPKEELVRPDTQAGFIARNSILSEFAVLGFEHGYSLENPNCLVLWEAQFGDFVNGAQIMIDQFIVAGEDKWLRQSGLVMLLPHGYDGQGAEHSSCRVERFLQQVDEDPHHIPNLGRDERMQVQQCNMQIVNCSTPANYFHCLRRQIHRDFRKPLVVVSPKNLLRHKRCISSLEDMGPGKMFQRVINETDRDVWDNPEHVKTLVFCSGQIYYELLAEREKQGRTDVALVRIEQIAPFPFDRIASNVKWYPNAEVIFAQQEPKNMGPYSYCLPRIMTATREINGDEKRPRYVGRAVSAAPATGMGKVHQLEYQNILDGVFGKSKSLGVDSQDI